MENRGDKFGTRQRQMFYCSYLLSEKVEKVENNEITLMRLLYERRKWNKFWKYIKKLHKNSIIKFLEIKFYPTQYDF